MYQDRKRMCRVFETFFTFTFKTIESNVETLTYKGSNRNKFLCMFLALLFLLNFVHQRDPLLRFRTAGYFEVAQNVSFDVTIFFPNIMTFHRLSTRE